MKKKWISLFLCSFLCLCIASCGDENSGQVAVSGEDYEYHFYNTQTAATEQYLICRGWLIPRTDETRLDGSVSCVSWSYGFDIGGDTLFFTQEDRLYSIKLEDAVSQAVAGKPLSEGLTPALEGFGYPKYYDGKLYVSDAGNEVGSLADRWKLKKSTTLVFDVTVSPWKLVKQGWGIVYPGADQPDLSQAEIYLKEDKEGQEIFESTLRAYQSHGIDIKRSPDKYSTFITNYDENWIYYMPIYGHGVYRTPYSATEFNEERQENISDFFPQHCQNMPRYTYQEYMEASEHSGPYEGFGFLDMIDGQIYFPSIDGHIYCINSHDLSEIHEVI